MRQAQSHSAAQFDVLMSYHKFSNFLGEKFSTKLKLYDVDYPLF